MNICVKNMAWHEAPSGKSFRLSDEAATSTHHGCIDYCGSSGGTLACLSSAEDAAFATALVEATGESSLAVWIGLFQPSSSDAAEPAGGWVCSSGEATSFADWAMGEPNDGLRNCIDAEENCAQLRPGGVNGSWWDVRCLSTSRCLCESAASSTPAYQAFASELTELSSREAAWEASTPRVTSFEPTTYTMDVHAPGHAACPCLQASERFGTHAADSNASGSAAGSTGGGPHFEWDQSYLQTKGRDPEGNLIGVVDFGRRYGLGCSDHDVRAARGIERGFERETVPSKGHCCSLIIIRLDPRAPAEPQASVGVRRGGRIGGAAALLLRALVLRRP